jgi:hypothetical protein
VERFAATLLAGKDHAAEIGNVVIARKPTDTNRTYRCEIDPRTPVLRLQMGCPDFDRWQERQAFQVGCIARPLSVFTITRR